MRRLSQRSSVRVPNIPHDNELNSSTLPLPILIGKNEALSAARFQLARSNCLESGHDSLEENTAYAGNAVARVFHAKYGMHARSMKFLV
jgi:hypothetical protein